MRSWTSISNDVDRGLVVVAEIARLKEEQKEIEARLKADALDRPERHKPLGDAEREGKQFIAHGSELDLPIVLTADKLVQSFAEESAVSNRIAFAACGKLASFYKRSITHETLFEDGKAFRAAALEILGPDRSPAFIAACRAVDKHGIPKSDIKVEWQSAAAAAKLEEVAS